MPIDFTCGGGLVYAAMKKLLTVFLAAVLLAACGPAAKKDSPVVATVNGENVYEEQLNQNLKFELSKYDIKIAEDPKRIETARRTVLDRMINDEILYQTAKKAGIIISNGEIDEDLKRYKSRYTEASFQKMLELKGIKYDQWREDKKRSIISDRLVEKEVVSKIDVSEAEIKKYYNARRKDFSHGEEIHARQILVDDAELAGRLRARLVAGENFAALAQEFSIAPEAKKGGDLGWFPRGRMPRAFDEACFPLPTGNISPVVKTEFGYHIFKVMGRREPASVKLEDVQDKIISRLKQEKMEESFNAWFEPIRKKAAVEIYEK